MHEIQDYIMNYNVYLKLKMIWQKYIKNAVSISKHLQ